MSQEFPFPLDSLRTAATTLVLKVNRNVLNDALVSSKLVRKDVSRDELKRICGSPETWLRFVFDRLTAPATQEAALRALSGLVDGSLPALDTRVITRMRKARTAAEQSHSDRLMRELESLDELRTELGPDNVPEPLPMVFVWLKANHARKQLISVASLLAPNSKSPTVSSRETRTGVASTSTGSVAVRDSQIITPDALAEELQSDAAFKFNAGPDWDAATAIAAIKRPEIVVQWPDFKPLQPAVTELATVQSEKAARSCAFPPEPS